MQVNYVYMQHNYATYSCQKGGFLQLHVGEREIYATIQTRLKCGTCSLKTIQAFLFKGIIVLTFFSFSIAGNPKGMFLFRLGR